MPSIKSPSTTRVPLLDLSAQNEPLREETLAAIARVVDSQRFIGGPELESLERELADMIGARHALGVSSGTDALLVAMMALGIGPGDEVITPTFSFFATAGCVSRLGATPKLVDIDPVTFNVNVHAVERAITPKTRAIIPVHLFGLCADMDPLIDVTRRRNIAVIEDAAQAIGSKYDARQAGTMGTFGCFSFFPSKNLGAFGDAGLVTTNDDALAARVKMLRNHGAEPKYYHKYIGGNFRLDALQASVLRVKLPHLAAWTEFRRRNAARYDSMFRAAGLDDVVTLPYEPANRYHIFNQYVIRAPRRDALRAHLDASGIGNEVYYPVPFHLQECFAPLGHRPGDFPEAESAAADVLAIPIYGELTEEQQSHVVERIAAFYAA
jgi:dTDP-4-amino-4,6-dideoxygalactose transaminase